MNYYKRILSLFVALILLFSSTIHVSAAEFQSPNAVVETAGKPVLTESSNAETQKESAVRISEVMSLRETNAETYLLSDGTYECVVYAEIITILVLIHCPAAQMAPYPIANWCCMVPV